MSPVTAVVILFWLFCVSDSIKDENYCIIDHKCVPNRISRRQQCLPIEECKDEPKTDTDRQYIVITKSFGQDIFSEMINCWFKNLSNLDSGNYDKLRNLDSCEEVEDSKTIDDETTPKIETTCSNSPANLTCISKYVCFCRKLVNIITFDETKERWPCPDDLESNKQVTYVYSSIISIVLLICIL